MCGGISDYERSTPAGPTNLFQATANNLTLRGSEGAPTCTSWPRCSATSGLRNGRIKYRESVTEGLENAPAALVDLLGGRNLGKTLIRIV